MIIVCFSLIFFRYHSHIRWCQRTLSPFSFLLPTAYVVGWKVMFWHVSVHPIILSVHTCGGGGTRPGPDEGWSTPPQEPRPPRRTWPGEEPSQVQVWGYPTSGNPPPHRTWLGVPLLWGTPPWVTPHQTMWGGTPPRVTDGVLDTPLSVCLLHSRRRTFLFEFYSQSPAFGFKTEQSI